MKKIYIGNLSYSVGNDELRDFLSAFEGVSGVSEVSVIFDRASGRSRGFAFAVIEIESDNLFNSVVGKLNGAVLNGRAIRVSEARSES